MSNEEQISKIIRMIENAESSIIAAKEMLLEISPDSLQATSRTIHSDNAKAYEEGESQIVEGTFDGQNMIGPNDKIYPVPANYASKSKMVEGDHLKLTILPNGSFQYKQISPIDRDFIKGTLIKEDGQFRVITDKGKYRVILASVTYYKGNPGDEVTLIVPKDKEATWGAIEAIIPQINNSSFNQEDSF